MTKGSLTLSVIVPTLNEERRLPGLVASLCESSEPPDEIIVVDGDSEDATVSVARGLELSVLRAARGRGTQLARGAERARGEILLFLHADARVESGALAALRRAHAGNALVATGMRQRIDHPGRIYRWIERAANTRVRLGRVYGDSGLCLRRSAYRRAGGFREIPIFEDLELSRRLRRQGPIRLVEEAVLVVSPRRWAKEGVLRATVRNWALHLAWAAGVDPGRLVRYYRPHAPAAERS